MTRIKEENKSKYMTLLCDEASSDQCVSAARRNLVECEPLQVYEAKVLIDTAWKRLDAAQKALREFLLDDSNFQ